MSATEAVTQSYQGGSTRVPVFTVDASLAAVATIRDDANAASQLTITLSPEKYPSMKDRTENRMF